MFQYLVLLFLASYAKSKTTFNCSERATALSYLDIASDMIVKAKSKMPELSDTENNLTPVPVDCTEKNLTPVPVDCTEKKLTPVPVDCTECEKKFTPGPTDCADVERNLTHGPVDCADVLRLGHRGSGVYTIWPLNRLIDGKGLKVYCDMDTDGGGWTLIQRRGNYGNPVDYFYKDWKSYREGFGDIEKDFWLGNNNIFALTNQKAYAVRFDLQDVELNKKYAQYEYFWTEDENSKYRVHAKHFSGNAGDSMSTHDNSKFSTKDNENDNRFDEVCAVKYKGGWWYNACHWANLNGLYLRGKHKSFADGVNWYSWKGHHESLESTEIKIRPKRFVAN